MKKDKKINYMTRIILLLCALGLFQIISGCFSSWAPSDEEALNLLKNYYSFYEEQGVEADIVNRGEIIEECSCYPIEFHIFHADRAAYTRTFYFYKNGDGTAGIKKFKFGVKYES